MTISAMSIKEEFSAQGMRFKDRHAQVIAAFQTGIMDGLADHVNQGLAIAHNEYFVDTWANSKNGQADSQRTNYTPFAGANKPDKRGKLKFKKGKIVSRTGQMAEAVSPVSWGGGDKTTIGTNKSPDMRIEIQKMDGYKIVKILLSGRTGKLMGIHINKSRIRILAGAFGVAGRNFKKLVNAGIIKTVFPLKVLRK